MHHVIAGLDGSAASAHALRWAADFAGRIGASLMGARVFEPTQAELPPQQDRLMHEFQREELEGWCVEFPSSTELLDGDPPDALLDAARRRATDLLVVGGRGSGGFADLHLGSTAHHLARHTTVPLAIVTQTSDTVGHLVAGVDGSSGSLAAVEFCARLAPGLGVGVTAVHAFEPFAEWVPASDPESWHSHAMAELEEWTAPIRDAGVPLETIVDRDIHPVAALERALADHPDAAAVVGIRGRGGFAGLRLGRVPLQLVHHTGATVIVIPAR